MKRIKVFTDHRDNAQKCINEWIDECKPADIISVTPSICVDNVYTHCIITVLYEDGNYSNIKL